jgi:hypothetical protein
MKGKGKCSDGKGEFGTKIYSFKGECGDGKAEKKRLMNEEIMSGG